MKLLEQHLIVCPFAANLDAQNNPDGKPNVPLTRAGGGFSMVAGEHTDGWVRLG